MGILLRVESIKYQSYSLIAIKMEEKMIPPPNPPTPSPLRKGIRLLAHLSWWDMVAQYFGSWVGLVWNFVMPATIILVYLAVFELSPGFRFGGHETVGGYGINLVAGLIPWLLFQEAVSRAANVFIEQRHLLSQVPIPPVLFPLASVGSALVRHFLHVVLKFPLFFCCRL